MSLKANTEANVLGTAEFAFSNGASTPAEAQAAGYEDVGNLLEASVDSSNETVEHLGANRGTRTVNRTAVTKTELGYKLKGDEIKASNLEIVLFGVSGAAFTQAALAAVAGETLAFGTTAAALGRWYNLRAADGSRLRDVTGVTIATLTEGTDFDLDLKLGRISFLTAQSSDLSPVITAPAITAGDAANMKQITPLSKASVRGIGHLIIFDDKHANKVVYEHKDFGCDITLESFGNFDGQNFTDYTLNVQVSSPVGSVWTAE